MLCQELIVRAIRGSHDGDRSQSVVWWVLKLRLAVMIYLDASRRVRCSIHAPAHRIPIDAAAGEGDQIQVMYRVNVTLGSRLEIEDVAASLLYDLSCQHKSPFTPESQGVVKSGMDAAIGISQLGCSGQSPRQTEPVARRL